MRAVEGGECLFEDSMFYLGARQQGTLGEFRAWCYI